MKNGLTFVCIAVMLTVACHIIYCSKESRGINGPEEKDYTGKITGYVSDKQGRPIKNVFVSIDADSATPDITNSEGKFSLGRIRAGTHTLRFSHPDYEDDSSHSVTLAKGEDVVMKNKVNLAYLWYIIGGQILHKNSGVPAAGVGIEGYPGYALTGSDGRYVIDKVKKCPEVKLICAKTNVGFGTKRVNKFVPDDTTWVNVSLDSAGATVSGTVYDSTGKPIAYAVVAAIGGGLVDTTDSMGRYTLKNVPSGNAVQIYVVSQNSIIGSIAGIKVNDGAFLPGVDITLRPAATLSSGKGMALEVSDVIVDAGAKSITLSVVPHSDSSTIIVSYEWTLVGKDSLLLSTKMPYLSISMDSLVKLCGGISQPVITAKVNAVSRENVKSPAQSFTILVSSAIPTVNAGVASDRWGNYTDTVTVYEGGKVWFYGRVYAPLGGIVKVSWSFGDGSADLEYSDSIPVFWNSYSKAGTYFAVFTATYGTGSTVRDTVKVSVIVSPLGRPV